MKKGFLEFTAFIGVLIIAVLEILSFLTTHDIIVVNGGTFIDVLNTIKNLCIVLVIGILSISFLRGKAKWIKVIGITSIAIIILTTIFIWIKF